MNPNIGQEARHPLAVADPAPERFQPEVDGIHVLLQLEGGSETATALVAEVLLADVVRLVDLLVRVHVGAVGRRVVTMVAFVGLVVEVDGIDVLLE